MLSTCESDSTSSFQLSSDFDFHLAARSVNFSNDSYNLSVIKVDDIIRFEKSLNLIVVNSDILRVGGNMEFSTVHVHA